MKLSTKLNNDIKKIKTGLIARAKEKGLWENFGQNEVNKLRDKYFDDMYNFVDDNVQVCTVINNFSNWCSNYQVEDKE